MNTRSPSEPARPGLAGLGRELGEVFLAILMSTGLCELIADALHPINLILIYLAAMVIMALRHGQRAAVLTLLTSVMVFDWLFVAPRWSLKPTDPQYFFTFAVALVVGLVVSHLTTQARKAAIERLRALEAARAVELQAEAERVRNTLLAGISHDFRTPLTTIMGAASSLRGQEGHLAPAQRDQLLAHIIDQARRLQTLSSDLLAWTRLNDGAVVIEPEWCPAGELVREALEQVAGTLKPDQCRLQLNENDLLWCDPRLMTQALANLLANAARHGSADPPVEIVVNTTDEAWVLCVQDHGPGIDPQELPDIFRRFVRGDRATGTAGSGLGLAICEAVVRLHGGHIEAANRNGAVFTITVPVPAQARDELTRLMESE